MVNSILIGIIFSAGVVHNVYNVESAFWVCFAAGILFFALNRKRIIQALE